jgi:hypothetical protein
MTPLKFLYNFLFTALFSAAALTCNTTDPPLELELKLELEDVSCTEAWIKLTTSNIQLPAEINLVRTDAGGNTVSHISILNTQDSLLYIDSLLPNQTYKLKAASTEYLVVSSEITVTTLDTTSHNFTFETWTFGTIGSSVLYDVAIINENNIWAVGVIYMKDSLGQPDPLPYNAVHWDGSNWKLKRVSVSFRGNIITPPLDGAFSFSETDIWFVGSLPIHGDGENWIMYDLRTTLDPNLSLLKAWGSSSNDMYFVGRNGSIARKNGSEWTKLESGTNLIISDIWGIENSDGSYNKYLAADDVMLIIDTKNNLQRINAEQGHSLSSAWGISDRLIYTAGGNGLSLYKNFKWEKINVSGTNTIRIVRGQNFNEVIGLGTPGIILKFNGFSWQSIDTKTFNIFYRLDIKNDLIASVGWQGDKAAITIFRNN